MHTGVDRLQVVKSTALVWSPRWAEKPREHAEACLSGITSSNSDENIIPRNKYPLPGTSYHLISLFTYFSHISFSSILLTYRKSELLNCESKRK